MEAKNRGHLRLIRPGDGEGDDALPDWAQQTHPHTPAQQGLRVVGGTGQRTPLQFALEDGRMDRDTVQWFLMARDVRPELFGHHAVVRLFVSDASRCAAANADRILVCAIMRVPLELHGGCDGADACLGALMCATWHLMLAQKGSASKVPVSFSNQGRDGAWGEDVVRTHRHSPLHVIRRAFALRTKPGWQPTTLLYQSNVVGAQLAWHPTDVEQRLAPDFLDSGPERFASGLLVTLLVPLVELPLISHENHESGNL